MVTTDDATDFIHIREGRGGTYDMTKTTWIGTYDCISCVGVYFRVDEKRSFCAHILPCLREGSDAQIISKEEGELLKQTVVEKVTKHARETNWRPEDVDKATLIVICPQPNLEPGVFPRLRKAIGTKMPGYYVIAAIKQFLSLEPEGELARPFQGFVVNHLNWKEKELAWPSDDQVPENPVEKPAAFAKYVAIEPPASEDWTIKAGDVV